MAIVVNNQQNPLILSTGTALGDCTIINTNLIGGQAEYEVSSRDGQTLYKFNTKMDITKHPQVQHVTADALHVILPFRTKFQVRARRPGKMWSSWVKFKTRDKRYSSPDVITTLVDDTETTNTQKSNRKIMVVNAAPSSVTLTSKGATVRSFSRVDARKTDHGATIVSAEQRKLSTGHASAGSLDTSPPITPPLRQAGCISAQLNVLKLTLTFDKKLNQSVVPSPSAFTLKDLTGAAYIGQNVNFITNTMVHITLVSSSNTLQVGTARYDEGFSPEMRDADGFFITSFTIGIDDISRSGPPNDVSNSNQGAGAVGGPGLGPPSGSE